MLCAETQLRQAAFLVCSFCAQRHLTPAKVRFLIAGIGKDGRAFYADELAGFGSFRRQDVINHAAVCAGCRLFPLYLPRIGQRGFHKRPIFLVR